MTALDDETLATLRRTLAAMPDDIGLRLVLLRAHHARGDDAAVLELIGDRPPEAFPVADHAAVGAALLDAQAGAAALPFLAAETAEAKLLRARTHLLLGNLDHARADYQRAVQLNPTLESKDLEARLFSRVFERPVAGDGPRLRVIANDDTSSEDVDRIVHPPAPPVVFDDVGGLQEVKQQIHRRIILPYQKPSLFDRFRKKVGGGILFYGPPGCGKTLLARATAGEVKAEFMSVAISDILDMYIGESERKLSAVFARARQKTPSIVFFDELEAIAGRRQYSREGTSAKLVSAFLAEMDGFSANNHGVLIIGATNVPWAIDPAFRRPGRFDRVLFIPPPDQDARASIIARLLRDRPVGDMKIDVVAKKVAAKTSTYSGADLQGVVDEAIDRAIEASLSQGQECPITEDALIGALHTQRPTTLEWLTTARNHARFANEGGQYDDVVRFLRQHGRE